MKTNNDPIADIHSIIISEILEKAKTTINLDEVKKRILLNKIREELKDFSIAQLEFINDSAEVYNIFI